MDGDIVIRAVREILYHTPFRQIARKLRRRGLNLPNNELEENIHKAIGWMSEKLKEIWMSQVRKSWIWMVDETSALVGCTDEETRERRYKNKYMWGIRANSVNLAWFIYENVNRSAEAIRSFLDGFIWFYTTDGYAVYKIFDSKRASEQEAEDGGSRKRGKRSACMVHIRRGFVDAIIENRTGAMWFIDEIGKLFSVIESCRMCGRSVDRYLTGLLERLKTAKDGDELTECLP